MMLTHCDSCSQEIKNREEIVTIRLGYRHFEFCRECSEPIANFLKTKNLAEEKST